MIFIVRLGRLNAKRDDRFRIGDHDGMPYRFFAVPSEVSFTSVPSPRRTTRLKSFTNAVDLPSGDLLSRSNGGSCAKFVPSATFSGVSSSKSGVRGWRPKGTGWSGCAVNSRPLVSLEHSYEFKSHCQTVSPSLNRTALPSFANSIVVLYTLSALLGAIVYFYFRVDVRPDLERAGHWPTLGLFDIKEHFVAIGLALLPAYWSSWRTSREGQSARARTALTSILAFIVWWSFLVGHVANNIGGFGR